VVILYKDDILPFFQQSLKFLFPLAQTLYLQILTTGYLRRKADDPKVCHNSNFSFRELLIFEGLSHEIRMSYYNSSWAWQNSCHCVIGTTSLKMLRGYWQPARKLLQGVRGYWPPFAKFLVLPLLKIRNTSQRVTNTFWSCARRR
jgi:hypothetical protein